MSATIYTDIRAALEQRLSTMPGLPAVAWENVKYVPVVGTPYLEPALMWAEGAQAEIGATGRNWERGIYQITAVFPLDRPLASTSLLMLRPKPSPGLLQGLIPSTGSLW